MTDQAVVFTKAFDARGLFVKARKMLGRATTLPRDNSAEATRNRRDFIQDTISRNPHAFSSDLDVQAMMSHYPGDF